MACPDCPGFLYRYHSCNDRHCPQCGQTDADQWLQRQRARMLLPTPYFLVTFTVPEELRMFIRSHQQIGLDLLFAASAQALQDLAGNPRRLGAQLGMLGVLHTWSRTLIFHPHIHYLVPGGGLSSDGRHWVAAKKFLLHHQALGDRCRTLFKNALQRAHPEVFSQVPALVWKRHWNVGCQAAGSGENALRYLSRYVFKTATSNRILTQLPEGKLRWDYRHSKTGRFTSVKLDPWSSWAVSSNTSCPLPLPGSGPLAGCIQPPKSAPTASGLCLARRLCSARLNNKPGTRRLNRFWKCQRTMRLPTQRHYVPRHCVRVAGKLCA